jgi:hypothetical protein
VRKIHTQFSLTERLDMAARWGQIFATFSSFTNAKRA